MKGIHSFTADVYHEERFAGIDAPCLSASLATTLLRESPLHAWAKHPKLGGAVPEESERFDLGTAAHAYILEGGRAERYAVIAADDWRTKAAQGARLEARAANKIPILSRQMDEVRQMAEAVQRQLATFADPPAPLSDGAPERSVLWQEDGTWCKARIDYLHHDHLTIDDLKTTSASAKPDAWTRTLYASGGDIQPAFYIRAVRAIVGIEPIFRFIVVENYPPFALSVVSLSPSALALAQDKVDQALRAWRPCLASGNWPGYASRVHHIEPPAWAMAEALEYEWAEPTEGGSL